MNGKKRAGPRKHFIRKRLNQLNKPKKEASRNKLVKKSGILNESNALKKLIVQKIVGEPGLSILNTYEID